MITWWSGKQRSSNGRQFDDQIIKWSSKKTESSCKIRSSNGRNLMIWSSNTGLNSNTGVRHRIKMIFYGLAGTELVCQLNQAAVYSRLWQNWREWWGASGRRRRWLWLDRSQRPEGVWWQTKYPGVLISSPRSLDLWRFQTEISRFSGWDRSSPSQLVGRPNAPPITFNFATT